MSPSPSSRSPPPTTTSAGLLGLAARDEQIYAVWTRAGDGRIVVAEVTASGQRLVWLGPPSSQRANGGHLAFLPDGRLLIGIGDLQQPDLVGDSDTPHGKLLVLDPSGPAEQAPLVLSGGWNNPFAFVVTRDGEVWVADNAPGDSSERLGRGDRDGPRTDLPGKRAPAVLLQLGPGLLGLCGYLDGELTVVDIGTEEPELLETVTDGCRTGAANLPDNRIATSDGEQVTIFELSDRRWGDEGVLAVRYA